MTVGIGVLCHAQEELDCVILASDMRLSYDHPRLGPHDKAGKVWDLPTPFIGAVSVAGTMWCVQRYVDEAQLQLIKLCKRERFTRRQLEDAIDRVRTGIHYRLCDLEMRKVLGFSLGQWQAGKVRPGKLDKLLLRKGIEVIKDVDFPVETITAGFLGDKLVWYKTSRLRPLQNNISPGYFVIGSGSTWAMKHLAWRQQTPDNRLPSSLLHVYEAMRRARRDKAVGLPQDYLIIWKDGRIGRISAEAPLLRNWAKHYKNRTSTASLDSSKIAEVQIDQMMRAHEIRDSAQIFKRRPPQQ